MWVWSYNSELKMFGMKYGKDNIAANKWVGISEQECPKKRQQICSKVEEHQDKKLSPLVNNVRGTRRSTLPMPILANIEDKINANVVIQYAETNLVTCHPDYVKVYRFYNAPYNTSKLKVHPS